MKLLVTAAAGPPESLAGRVVSGGGLNAEKALLGEIAPEEPAGDSGGGGGGCFIDALPRLRGF